MVENSSDYIIGVDVGGTNTDSVLVGHPSQQILNAAKTSTTKDIFSGVQKAIKQVSEGVADSQSKVRAVILGTTVFVNAVLQCSEELEKVSVVRLCGPASRAIPPFSGWPKNLKTRINENVFFANGGYEFNATPITEVNQNELELIANQLCEQRKGTNNPKPVNVVISAVFSPQNPDQEIKASQIMASAFRLNNVPFTITLSHKLSELGMLERENAAILNASLMSLAKKSVQAFLQALKDSELLRPTVSIFLTQNDGTLITGQEAMEYPVFTFASGTTNSLRGAAKLTNIADGIVVDIGGTSTDVNILQNSFPRPSSSHVDVGGVRTNFRMPDTVSIALGGGSLVKFCEDGSVKVGPQSVGYQLTKVGIAFGGNVLTATDVALAQGLFTIEGADPSKVKLTQQQIDKVSAKIREMLDEAIDRVKTSSKAEQVILVGGGSVLIPPNANFKGVSSFIVPEKFFGNANALGAAISQVSAQVSRIEILEGRDKFEVLKVVEEEAMSAVARKGAVQTSIKTVPDIIPLGYLPEKGFKYMVKAIGDLDIRKLGSVEEQVEIIPEVVASLLKDEQPFEEKMHVTRDDHVQINMPGDHVFQENNGRKEWVLSEEDLDCIALGAGILGCGGGGSPYLGLLGAKEALFKGKKIRVVNVLDLTEQDFVGTGAFMGAPFIQLEKLVGGEEVVSAVKVIDKEFPLEKITALMSLEIGGTNSLCPLYTGALMDLPVVDADTMGRAFPKVNMTSLFIQGMKSGPYAYADEKGNTGLDKDPQSQIPENAQNALVAKLMQMGLIIGISFYPMNAQDIKNKAVPHSLSRCWRLGYQLLKARKLKTDPFLALEKEEGARMLYRGKIVYKDLVQEGGWNFGQIRLQGIDEFKDKEDLELRYQNELLVAYLVGQNGQKKYIASVPDLICMVDNDKFTSYCCEDLKFGLRVAILLIPSVPMMATAQALKTVGPQCFGYDDVKYCPIGGFKEQHSEVPHNE